MGGNADEASKYAAAFRRSKVSMTLSIKVIDTTLPEFYTYGKHPRCRSNARIKERSDIKWALILCMKRGQTHHPANSRARYEKYCISDPCQVAFMLVYIMSLTCGQIRGIPALFRR